MDERRPTPVVPRRAQTGTGVKILILTGYYLPGYKGGGPMRTLSNMVDRRGDECRFRVVPRTGILGRLSPIRGSFHSGAEGRVFPGALSYKSSKKTSLEAAPIGSSQHVSEHESLDNLGRYCGFEDLASLLTFAYWRRL
jgi:hypothetical protein